MPARRDMRQRSPRSTSVTADGQGLGVHSGPAIRNLDTMLQGELFSQNATVAGLQTRQTALQAIDAVQGTPGQGSDIASLLGQLQDQFSTLLNDPGNAPQQSQVVSTATTLAQGINDAQRRLHDAAPDGAGQHRRRSGDAELHAWHDRRAEQQDHRAEGERPEHRRSREPARRGAGGPVAAGRHQGAGAAERRRADRHDRRSVLPTHGTANPFATSAQRAARRVSIRAAASRRSRSVATT